MDPVQRVKIAFLLKCADDGLTAEEILYLVKTALHNKEAFGIGEAAKGLGWLGSSALTAGLLAPTIAGAGAGYGLAKMHSDEDADVAAAKQEELEDEYRRLAAEAAANAKRRQLAALTGQRVTRLSRPRLSN